VLARITYGLVVVALGCFIGGFFTRESNVLLFVSIGLSVVAIALVLVGWARRAREAPSFDELAYASDEDEALVGALSDEELAFVEERAPRRARRAKASTARPRTKPKAAKPKAKPKAKPAVRRSTARKPSKPASARKPKPKSTARKPQARPKRKPPRRRPETR
jgi:outer membrane biosynthesis protein TonB